MAHLAAVKRERYKFGSTNFPILYENNDLRVYKNSSDEIFVEDIRSGTTMRISSFYRYETGGLQFTADLNRGGNSLVEPVQVCGGIRWRVGPR